jgi:hypothetical protein
MRYCFRSLVGLLCVALQVLAFRSSVVWNKNNENTNVRPRIVDQHHAVPWSTSTTRLFSSNDAGGNNANANDDGLYTNTTSSSASSSWTKTRNYLYRATAITDDKSDNKLTVHQVKQVLAFLRSNFPPDTCRLILQTSPRILRKNCATFLQPTVDFLRELYRDDMLLTAVHRNPDLLLTSGMGYDADALELVEVFLRQEVQLSKTNMAKLKRTAPFVFQLPVYKLLSVLNFLTHILVSSGEYQAGDQETRDVLAKLVMSHPQILQLSVESNLRPRLDFFKERCHLLTSDLAVLVKKSSASVLALSVKDNLEPTIDFLTDLLRDRPDPASDLRKCLRSHPQLLALSLKNLHSKKAYFDAIDQNNHLSCSSSSSSSSLASRVLIRSPAVYSLSLGGNIVPTIEFMARVWGTKAPPVRWEDGDTDDDGNGNANDNNKSSVEPMIRDNDGSLDSSHSSEESSLVSLLGEYPSILTLSLEGNIQPTINFYNRTGYIQLDGDWNLVRGKTMSAGKVSVLRGRYIAASLFNRLLPRWHYCQSVASSSVGDNADGEDNDDNDNDTVPVIPLHVLVSATDSVFCDQMGIDHDDYIKYKTESIPRLKFSSQFDTWLKTGRPIDV